jgi:hypothetical protein
MVAKNWRYKISRYLSIIYFILSTYGKWRAYAELI